MALPVSFKIGAKPIYNVASGRVSVTAYGADPLGIKDSTAAINLADQVATGVGLPLYFPAGTYSINVGTRVTRNGASWVGDGQYVSILKSAAGIYSAATQMVTCSGLSGFTTADLGFDLSQATFTAGSTYRGILFFNCTNWTMSRCAVTGIQDFVLGVYPNGGDNWAISNCYFNNASPSTNQSQAINVQQNSGKHEITDNVCIGTGIFSNASNGLFRGNIVSAWKFGSGIVLGPIAGQTGNRVLENYCVGGAGNPDVNNTYSAGIECWAPSTSIIGNHCVGNAGAGISVGGTACSVIGNHCLNNDFLGGVSLGGITVFGVTGFSGSNSHIIGNECSDNQGSPTQAYGILETHGAGANTSPVTGVQIVGNTFAGNTVAAILRGSAVGDAAGGLELDRVNVFVGSGAPAMSAPQGSLYLRLDGSSTSTRAYINTNGSTTWTSVTTAT